MKSKIASLLLFAVATQAQFIDGYVGYPLPNAAPVQWLSQGQLVPSSFYPVYPSNYNRDIAGNQVNSWAYYNPIVQVDANAVQAGAAVDFKSSVGPVRTKRQIQLHYRAAAKRGRSLNDHYLSKDTKTGTLASTPARKQRQIQLRYRGGASRRGRSVNGRSSFQAKKSNEASVRNERQILLRYRNNARRRVGRSVNEPSFTRTMSTH